ncbi:MAG TPA: ribulose-phosphate 3-epimerase [Elusimicrobia bacterium]|nr:MAG: ribulose-phosphate 3-epimerase [Elusimicrobia bacterium GWA2_64_40]OGR65594.1 MAG: ribulose-phosphate 3-epimerase [Elusimicrobia bacterium GWB2_63_16]HAN04613.1 ribulose-phosphate 3-epimerase [Elusimicrobiota bacterium]HAU90305.1 ribulose-phosphate 3-epimerase [Elusimicrobiota bacterium]
MTPSFPLPSGRLALCPSVLSADFTCLKGSLARVSGNSDWMHVDVMDGRFVPNISFGPVIVPAVLRAGGLPADSHLMVENPAMFIAPFAKAGASLITIHAEARGAAACLRQIKALGLKAGMSLRPKTPLSRALPYLRQLDLLLIMTVEPGFGGQAFMADMLPKVRAARAAIVKAGRPVWLQVDGGINADTAAAAVAAGADALVIGSALFSARNPAAMLKGLRKI